MCIQAVPMSNIIMYFVGAHEFTMSDHVSILASSIQKYAPSPVQCSYVTVHVKMCHKSANFFFEFFRVSLPCQHVALHFAFSYATMRKRFSLYLCPSTSNPMLSSHTCTTAHPVASLTFTSCFGLVPRVIGPPQLTTFTSTLMMVRVHAYRWCIYVGAYMSEL